MIRNAQIPVKTDEGIELVQWDKRQGEDPDYDVPVTGWARMDSLVQGKWNRYNPRKVKIPALAWMEKDTSRQSH